MTGKDTFAYDLRHTIALAILMTRSGVHDHMESYLETILKRACDDGGWSQEFGGAKSDLPTTVYTVEYLAICSRYCANIALEIQKTLRSGQEWLILTADDGWTTGIFDKPWDRLWSTAYLLQRLFAANLPLSDDWLQTLVSATKYLLSDEASEIEYGDRILQFRVEARVAAALSWGIKVLAISPLLKENIEAWLQEWKQRFLNIVQDIPFKECDLATATFAARALLHDMNYQLIGKSVLTKRV